MIFHQRNLSVPELIFQAAGGVPEADAPMVGDCRCCGAQATVGREFAGWVKDSFTNHDRLGAGKIVCAACQFCFSEDNRPLQMITGREKKQKFRTYSHFVNGGKWHPLTKAQKPLMKKLLFDEKTTVAVIADSGQKHLAFRAVPGWWQFEEYSLIPRPAETAQLIATAEEMMTGGFSKTEIQTGNYKQKSVLGYGMENWRLAEERLRHKRGSPYFDLAIFLSQKPEENDTKNLEDI